MTAYFILTHTITDVETYRSEYIPQVLTFIAKYDGEIIVASPDAEPLQGNPAKGVVVIRFPSEEAVRGFVNEQRGCSVHNDTKLPLERPLLAVNYP